MIYDFDAGPDRRATESEKWRAYPPDVLPLWVADMDFVSPEPVIRALRERVVRLANSTRRPGLYSGRDSRL